MTKNELKEGYRLVPLNFSPQKGIEMTSIIDGKGKIFESHPYNIPQEPHKVLAFALNHILMMIDTGLISSGEDQVFITEKERLKYSTMTLELLRNLECFPVSGINIEYQE